MYPKDFTLWIAFTTFRPPRKRGGQGLQSKHVNRNICSDYIGHDMVVQLNKPPHKWGGHVLTILKGNFRGYAVSALTDGGGNTYEH
jgi:hypothetical protein